MHQQDNSISDHLVVRPAHLKDDDALLKLISVPMTTKGVMLSFQRKPSYFNAAKVLYTIDDHCVIEDIKNHKLVACYSNGIRPCYIDGQIRHMRYACDLRIDPIYRGVSLMKMLGTHMSKTMKNPDFTHIIIFNDNIAARKAVQTGRTGIPDYHEGSRIETLTLTGFKNHKSLQKYLQTLAGNFDLNQLERKTAQTSHIAEMNDFIKKMSSHYNFIPAYDFKDLIVKSDYYQGLSISDFQLYYHQGELVGMFGLWSQSIFKQTMILDYGRTVGVLRPLYNILAYFSGKLLLPKKGNAFKYHVLHSLLCDPKHLILHHRMLEDAFNLSKQKNVGAISYTLSQRDPRQTLNQFYKGEILFGLYGFLCNTHDPNVMLDGKRIPYFEVGRI